MDSKLFNETYSFENQCCVANGFWTFYFENQEVMQSHEWSIERKLLASFKAGFEFCRNGWIKKHELEILGTKDGITG